MLLYYFVSIVNLSMFVALAGRKPESDYKVTTTFLNHQTFGELLTLFNICSVLLLSFSKASAKLQPFFFPSKYFSMFLCFKTYFLPEVGGDTIIYKRGISYCSYHSCFSGFIHDIASTSLPTWALLGFTIMTRPPGAFHCGWSGGGTPPLHYGLRLRDGWRYPWWILSCCHFERRRWGRQ